MAKGISAVIATVMLLMITVALIGVFYVFGGSLMSTTSGTAGDIVAGTEDKMLQAIALETATCGNTTSTNNIINFTLQNTGTKDIVSSDVKIYMDGTDVTPTAGLTGSRGMVANSRTTLSYGTTSSATVGPTTGYSAKRTLKVTGPSNYVETELRC